MNAAPTPHADATPVVVRRLTLRGLDSVGAEALGVFLWSDARPLSGVAALVDWRTCGALSSLIVGGELTGRAGEALLLPLRGRLGQMRLFVFGLGSALKPSPERFRAAVHDAFVAMRGAGVRPVVFAAPHSPTCAETEGMFVAAVAEELPHRVSSVLLAALPRGAHRGARGPRQAFHLPGAVGWRRRAS